MHALVERQPKGITVIIVVNIVACLVTIGFWVLVYLRLFTGPALEDPSLRSSASATLGFLVGDLVWAAPLLMLSAIDLARRREWGLLLAQLTNILWLYSLTVIWVRDLYSHFISPGAILFTPFAIFALWAILYLWRERNLFS